VLEGERESRLRRHRRVVHGGEPDGLPRSAAPRLRRAGRP
jgi:hypothetical protein